MLYNIKATEFLEESLSKLPTLSEAWKNLSIIEKKNHQYKKSELYLKRYLYLDQKSDNRESHESDLYEISNLLFPYLLNLIDGMEVTRKKKCYYLEAIDKRVVKSKIFYF
ncbi:MAG: hypothetical protein LUD02_10540 [Tannerellaceae bacterium]|nr:hypothetical protein [Tannerellaceae bacterium]